MGRHKLWFEHGDRFVHRSNKYALVRPAGEGWQLLIPDEDQVVFQWGTRKRNPPFTEANKKIKFIESEVTDNEVHTYDGETETEADTF